MGKLCAPENIVPWPIHSSAANGRVDFRATLTGNYLSSIFEQRTSSLAIEENRNHVSEELKFRGTAIVVPYTAGSQFFFIFWMTILSCIHLHVGLYLSLHSNREICIKIIS